MEKKNLRNEYRCINDGEKSQWKQLTSIGEFIWDGVYAIRLVMNDSSLDLPFKFNGEEVVNLLVNDQFPDNHIQNNRIIVQTLTRVDRATGDVLTYTRSRRYSNGEHKWGEWVNNDNGSNSGGVVTGSSIAVDKNINIESTNPVQNKAIAKALEDAVARGRELAKRDLYIAAGALYNDTDEVIKRTAFWGEEVDHLPKHYYLNGLGDIGEEEMMKIYQHKDDMTMFLTAKNQSRFFQYGAFNGYRTIFGTQIGLSFLMDVTIDAVNPFASTNDLTIIKWLSGNELSIRLFKANGLWHEIRNVKAIDVYKETNPVAFTYAYAYALEHLRLKELSVNVNLKDSSKISKESILYMIENSKATTNILITMHPNAYERLSKDVDIISVLETTPLITLVSA